MRTWGRLLLVFTIGGLTKTGRGGARHKRMKGSPEKASGFKNLFLTPARLSTLIWTRPFRCVFFCRGFASLLSTLRTSQPPSYGFACPENVMLHPPPIIIMHESRNLFGASNRHQPNGMPDKALSAPLLNRREQLKATNSRISHSLTDEPPQGADLRKRKNSDLPKIS